MSFQSSCPACASPVEFGLENSILTVCKSCSSLVGRGDGKLEDFGEVADLVQTDSPLQLGMRGKYKGVPFEIVGRTQIRHSAGGVWDEWYAAFRGGQRWGWLAEAQGKVYLTFEKELPATHAIPPFDELDVDDGIKLPEIGVCTVAEIGEGEYFAAEGEIPFQFRPGETIQFADLSGPGKKFATIDVSDGTLVLYAGGQVTFKQLGIADAVANREKELQQVAGVKVSCPNCAGPLELKAPDQTLRVACQFCGSLLDVSEGNLKFLETMGDDVVKPTIPLGTVGTIKGEMFGETWSEDLEFTVIGFVRKKTVYEGTSYYWDEYLLYKPRVPFHWLIQSEGNWNFGKPVTAGEVSGSQRKKNYDGKTFAIYDRAKPTVTHVLGEFYWKVSVGEETKTADYIRPPYMLSRAATLPDENNKKEVNYTVSTYFPTDQVETAFGVQDLRRPFKVGPNQPYPHKGIYKMALAMWCAAMLIAMLVFACGGNKQVFSETFHRTKTDASKAVDWEQPLKIAGGKNIRIECKSTPWCYVAGEFYGTSTHKLHKFGVQDDKSVFMSSLPGGEYTLKLQPQWQANRPNNSSFKITIHQGVPRLLHLFLLVLGITIMPIMVAIHQFTFNVRRWSESDYSPYAVE